MAKEKEKAADNTKQEPVIRAKEWIRHTLLKYGLKMEDTAGLSQQDAEQMLEDCREAKRERMERPATEAQMAELEKMGIPLQEGMTVKQASDAMRDHYRRQAPPATEAQKKWLAAHYVKEDIVTKAEASRAIARHIAREEIPRYMPPKDGKFSPKDLYLMDARRQYEANDRSFRNYDEIGIVKKLMAEGVSEGTIRSTVSVYSPVSAKCTENQLDYLLKLAASDKKVMQRAEEKQKKVRPPSEKQLAMMKKKKIPYREGMSSLQANALIARKLNLETLQNHKPDLAKENNPVEFYRSFAQAELRKNGWQVERYSDSQAVIAMAERGFTKSVICDTLNGNSPKCGKSQEEWLERTVGRVLEKHEKDKLDRPEQGIEQADSVKEEMNREVSMASLGREVSFEDEPKMQTQGMGKENEQAGVARPDMPDTQEKNPLKYELTNITMGHEGVLVRRIRALQDIPSIGVKAGDFGGYVMSVKNLSQEGDCWVAEEAKVYRNAIVCEDAVVCGKAEVTDRALVAGKAWVDGESHVQGNAILLDNAVVNDHGVVTENGFVCEEGFVNGFACVKGNGVVNGTGISGKTVVDSYEEDLRPFLADIQQGYRDSMQAEYIQVRAGAEKIAHLSDQKSVAVAALERPVRKGLEKDSGPMKKKSVVRKRAAKEKEQKNGPRKV